MPIDKARLLQRVNTIDDLKRFVRDHGSYFFENDGFHRSRPVAVLEHRMCPGVVFWIERYRSAYMGGVRVQVPHDRIFSINKLTGEITDHESTTARKSFKLLMKYTDR